MVDEYLEEYGNSYDWEDKWWGDKNITWSEAIERAWRLGGRTGNRFPILPFKSHHATFLAMRSSWLFGTLFSLLSISRSIKKSAF